MECLAGVAATGGVAAKEAYEYNRENFRYDRELRRRKEMQVQKFRVEQAELWRKDVRDLISLTEYKMHVYLLVNVLLLGFSVALWCQGKLPHTTPVWLMTGNALATAGAFVFILLSIWMAMHAAVAAQGFETRLLTQMVRLPIPTWQEIEACRTYASEFERLEAQQMFRIPFVMGKQEGLVPVAEENEMSSNDPGSPRESTSSARFGDTAGGHIDPWGLEGSGAHVQELGCKQGSSMVKLRHVKLARQAMVFWQSYDSFARVSMSIGVNQLLLAASYFILGYYLAEVKVASSATYGVVVLTGMAETLNRLDMSLSWWQLRLVQGLLFLGPAIATAAGWAHLAEGYERLAEGLVVCAFLSHALYLTLVNSLCHVRMEHNGTHLPVAFRSVLYLDVFGWSQTQEQLRVRVPGREAGAGAGARDARSGLSGESPASAASEFGNLRQTGQDIESSWGKPATDMIEHDQSGRPVPHRPEEAAPEGAADDFRDLPGAADSHNPRNPSTGNYVEFFQAGSWMGEGHNDMDNSRIETGHEHEAPLLLPWKTFAFAMNLLCLAWLCAAAFFAMDAAHLWGSSVATYTPEHKEQEHHSLVQNERGLLGLSFLSKPFYAASTISEEGFSEKEVLDVSWPHENVEPHGLACDAAGTRFVASDGLTLFTAEIKTIEPSSDDQTNQPQILMAKFEEVNCPPVAGEGLQDAAVICPTALAGCEALVLHKYGRRMASCPVGQTQTAVAFGGYQADVSDAWLEELRVGRSSSSRDVQDQQQPHSRIEKAVSLASDSGCAGEGDNAWAGCVLLGTTRGRVVRLASSAGRSGMLSPAQALLEREIIAGDEPWKPGAVRSVGDAYFGVLTQNGTALKIQQEADGEPAGHLAVASKASGFCAGGGHIYFLEPGPSPQIWRMPLPRSLSPREDQPLQMTAV